MQKQRALDIFLAGVDSVKPDNLMKRHVSVDNDLLRINGFSFDLRLVKHIYVVGFGKASAAMSQALEAILGPRIAGGCIITKYGHSVAQKYVDIIEAGHPVPDENGISGTERILSIVNNAGEDDLVICLISGGGSALLADVPEGCTLTDLKSLNDILLKTGADITEMNCIRKHLSGVKGGLLSKAAYPAQLVSLIISDVIGDPLDVIASGPTNPDPTTFADALLILKKYGIEKLIPSAVYRILMDGAEGKRGETLKPEDEVSQLTKNLVTGTNLLALKAAKEKAEAFGYTTRIVTNELQGDVSDVAAYIIESAKATDKNTCLLFAGEPTIKVTGAGLGGRSQHLALLIAGLLKDVPGATILVAGTDGTDGPTDAAGAVVDSHTWKRALERSLDMEQYIRNNDAYNFFAQEGGLIITGPTQTNVMDLMIALIQ
jgi:glycerate-2-kinase